MKKRQSKIKLLLLFFILAMAFFLRFYKLRDFQFFTYDQARDTLIIKRIIVDKKLTLIGPTILIPGVYLPPFYYYLMAPVLFLGKLNPLALDIFSGFMGVGLVLAVFWATNQFFGKPAGFFSAFLLATSPLMVDLSRRAWNPNSVPILSLILIYFLYQSFKKKQGIFLFLSSLIFGFSLSFHYSIIGFLPVLLLAFYWQLKSKKKFFWIMASVLTIFLLISPLFLFELRHNFSLTKNFLDFFNSFKFQGKIVSLETIKRPLISFFQLAVGVPFGYFQKSLASSLGLERYYLPAPLIYAPVSIVSHQKQVLFYPQWAIIIWLLAIGASFKIYRQYRLAINLFLGLILSGVLISSLYPGDFHFYFYDFLFPVSFLFLGLSFKIFWQKKIFRPIILLLIFSMGIVNSSFSLKQEASEPTVNQIIKVSQVIGQDIGETPFNLAVNHRYADRWDHNAVEYRYFVEAYFKKVPLSDSPADYTKAESLYFIDEAGSSKILDVKIMEVEEFRAKEIAQEWDLDGVKLYKLTK